MKKSEKDINIKWLGVKYWAWTVEVLLWSFLFVLVDREIYTEQDGVSCKDVIVNLKGSFMDQVHMLLSL